MSAMNLVTMPKPKRPRKPNKVVRGEGYLFRRGDTFYFELNWKGSRTRKSLGTTDRETALIKMSEAVAAIRVGRIAEDLRADYGASDVRCVDAQGRNGLQAAHARRLSEPMGWALEGVPSADSLPHRLIRTRLSPI